MFLNILKPNPKSCFEKSQNVCYYLEINVVITKIRVVVNTSNHTRTENRAFRILFEVIIGRIEYPGFKIQDIHFFFQTMSLIWH